MRLFVILCQFQVWHFKEELEWNIFGHLGECNTYSVKKQRSVSFVMIRARIEIKRSTSCIVEGTISQC